MGDIPFKFSDHDRIRSTALLTCAIVVVLSLGGAFTNLALNGARQITTNSTSRPSMQAWFANPTQVNLGVTPGQQLKIEYLGTPSGRVGVLETWTKADGTAGQLRLSSLVESGRKSSFLVTVPNANATTWFVLRIQGVRTPLQVWVL